MKFVGPHVSIGGGVHKAPLNAQAFGAKGFGMFSKNQRQWQSPPLQEEEIALFKENMQLAGYQSHHVLVHSSYLINIGNPDPEKRLRSLVALREEVLRLQALGLTMLNFHPGSHLRQISPKECVTLIAQNINSVLSETEGVTLVLETTAGQGSSIGACFQELADIIGLVSDHSRIGVCFDTCHLFAAGYDIRTSEVYEKMMMELGELIGLSFLRGIHLNDAKSTLGSRVDRHQSIGKGTIGLPAFKLIMNDPRLEGLPVVLETIDPSLWAEEISLLYSLVDS